MEVRDIGMKMVTDKKFYCLEPENFMKFAEFLGFKKMNENHVVDEYFIDYDSKFIKNLNCLRIRKINDNNMYITYKGKSDSLLGKLHKFDNNINANISEYENYVNLFFSLGYYSYVIADKKKIVYEMNDKKFKYIIKIDVIPEVGSFIMFELDTVNNRIQKQGYIFIIVSMNSRMIITNNFKS
jgi:adenylate cyclase class IV